MQLQRTVGGPHHVQAARDAGQKLRQDLADDVIGFRLRAADVQQLHHRAHRGDFEQDPFLLADRAPQLHFRLAPARGLAIEIGERHQRTERDKDCDRRPGKSRRTRERDQ